MNKVILIGRLTSDPAIRYKTGENATAIGSYTLAVDRKYKRDGEPTADFLRCVCFGKAAEFAEKYLKQGTKIVVEGRIQTGSYTNKEGVKVYTTDIIVESQEFAESKNASSGGNATENKPYSRPSADSFNNVADDISEEELPWQ